MSDYPKSSSQEVQKPDPSPCVLFPLFASSASFFSSLFSGTHGLCQYRRRPINIITRKVGKGKCDAFICVCDNVQINNKFLLLFSDEIMRNINFSILYS